MKKYLLIFILLLNGCALTEARDAYIKRLESVQIGDTYQEMLNKVVDKPYDVTCYKGRIYETCTAMYNISEFERVIFRFNSDDVLISIYW